MAERGVDGGRGTPRLGLDHHAAPSWHLPSFEWREAVLAGAFVLLPWTLVKAASRLRSRSVKNWKRSLQRPPKPPLWWLLRRAMPLVYGSAGLASLLAVRATGDGGSLLNAVSLLVRKNGTTESVSSNNYARTALALYGCALLMDVMWSPLLHGAKRIGEAAVLRAAAATTLACTIPLMAIGVNPLAGALLLPLFAWECSGAYWNYALYRLNGSSIREKRRHRDTHGYTTLGEE